MRLFRKPPLPAAPASGLRTPYQPPPRPDLPRSSSPPLSPCSVPPPPFSVPPPTSPPLPASARAFTHIRMTSLPPAFFLTPDVTSARVLPNATPLPAAAQDGGARIAAVFGVGPRSAGLGPGAAVPSGPSAAPREASAPHGPGGSTSGGEAVRMARGGLGSGGGAAVAQSRAAAGDGGGRTGVVSVAARDGGGPGAEGAGRAAAAGGEVGGGRERGEGNWHRAKRGGSALGWGSLPGVGMTTTGWEGENREGEAPGARGGSRA